MTTRRRWIAGLTLYLLGIFMGAIDTGIITPARTIVQNDLGVDDQQGIWMITVYTLAYAASIPLLGKLADRNGRKPIYLASIALFGVGSLLCGLSQDFGSFPMLIAARAIQAIGGGGILPIATAEIGTEVPPERQGLALGLVGAVFGVANIFGASVGSLILGIVGSANWQWIFYVNLPIAAGIVVGGTLLLPNHRAGAVKRIDVWGTLLLVGMILSLLYGLRTIDYFALQASLSRTDTYPYLLVFLGLLPLFVLAERRAADPVLSLGYFTNRGVGVTLLLSLVSGFILMGVVFIPQLAENALRIPTGSGGYLVIILGLASGIGAPLSGRLTDAWGPRTVLAIGGMLSLLATAAVVWWLIPHPGLASVIVSLAFIGLGLGFVIGSPLNVLMLLQTPPEESSSALGTLSLVRSIGTTLAPAIMVGFLANAGAALPDRLTATLPTTIAVPELPHAKELDKRLRDLRRDKRMKDKLADIDFPDLADKTTVEIDNSTSGALPDDLVELLQTADVTTITERSGTVAKRMFEQESPAQVEEIQEGVQTGIDGLTEGVRSLTKSHRKLTSSILKADRKRRKLQRSITSMTASLGRISAGIARMNRGVAGITRAVTGLNKARSGLGSALAGMHAALAKQRAALRRLNSAPNAIVLRPQIIALSRSIASLETKRRMAHRRLGSINAQSSRLQGQRAKLVSARAKLRRGYANLARARMNLRVARSALGKVRVKLVKARRHVAATRAKLIDTIDKMKELKRAVPGAFETALRNYLIEIERRGPRLEAVFQQTLNTGFRNLYLLYGVASGLLLLLLSGIPSRRRLTLTQR